jgi:hypothetical protein
LPLARIALFAKGLHLDKYYVPELKRRTKASRDDRVARRAMFIPIVYLGPRLEEEAARCREDADRCEVDGAVSEEI